MLAIILDGIDGRLARYFRATSRFGEQLDSLADFVNFGVAPAIFIFIWRLDGLSSFGWICALVFAICTGLQARPLQRRAAGGGAAARLASRFLRRRTGAGGGGPAAPAILPAAHVHAIDFDSAAIVVAIYTVFIALLMVSRIPTLSGKRFGRRIPRERRASGARRRRASRGASRQLSVLLPCHRRRSPISRTSPSPGARASAPRQRAERRPASADRSPANRLLTFCRKRSQFRSKRAARPPCRLLFLC